MRGKYFIILFFLTIFVSCNSDDGNILADQVTSIESYLKSQNRQYQLIDGVYKSMLTTPVTPEEPVVPPVDPEEPEVPVDPEIPVDPVEPEPEVPTESQVFKGTRAGEIVLQNGDIIYINYIAQLFNSSPSGVYATNIKLVAEQVGFDTVNIEYVPLEIKYGETVLIAGLRLGLQGAKKGDSFSLFMPYTLAYGDKQNGVVPAQSAINIDIDVIDIIRK